MSAGVRVFVNSRPVTLDTLASVLDAVRALDQDLAAAVESGSALVTDGVGRRIASSSLLGPGAIIRVVRSATPGEPGE